MRGRSVCECNADDSRWVMAQEGDEHVCFEQIRLFDCHMIDRFDQASWTPRAQMGHGLYRATFAIMLCVRARPRENCVGWVNSHICVTYCCHRTLWLAHFSPIPGCAISAPDPRLPEQYRAAQSRRTERIPGIRGPRQRARDGVQLATSAALRRREHLRKRARSHLDERTADSAAANARSPPTARHQARPSSRRESEFV